MSQADYIRKWQAENTICVNLRINRNQDPELFSILQNAENKSAAIRELLQKSLIAAKN